MFSIVALVGVILLLVIKSVANYTERAHKKEFEREQERSKRASARRRADRYDELEVYEEETKARVERETFFAAIRMNEYEHNKQVDSDHAASLYDFPFTEDKEGETDDASKDTAPTPATTEPAQ